MGQEKQRPLHFIQFSIQFQNFSATEMQISQLYTALAWTGYFVYFFLNFHSWSWERLVFFHFFRSSFVNDRFFKFVWTVLNHSIFHLFFKTIVFFKTTERSFFVNDAIVHNKFCSFTKTMHFLLNRFPQSSLRFSFLNLTNVFGWTFLFKTFFFKLRFVLNISIYQLF